MQPFYLTKLWLEHFDKEYAKARSISCASEKWCHNEASLKASSAVRNHFENLRFSKADPYPDSKHYVVI